MKAFVLLVISIKLFAGYCYSILTKVDSSTPVSENYFYNPYSKERCNLFIKPPLFRKANLAYVGCYKKEKDAKKVLETLNFNFKDPKIVYHKVNDGIPYVIFPQNSFLSLTRAKKYLQKIYRKYTPHNVLRQFPQHLYGEGIELYDLDKANFIPSINLYSFYMFNNHKNRKILVLYDGVYSLEYIYKRLNNPNLIKKIDNKTYEINISIFVSSTAKLVIKNKTVRLQTLPNPIFIVYYGELYLANSRFVTWDTKRDRYCPRENIPKEKILYINYEKPRPYFLGLSGSKSYFVNNIFDGLGFHSTSATFGIGLLSPKKNDFIPYSQAMYYFLSHMNAPTGAYIGNDILNSTMGFYTNGAKDAVYLGNFTYNNQIYNFDPHDYSINLVIAKNIAMNSEVAHGFIVSRGVEYSYMVDNIALNNRSNGLMVDRLSNNNIIYNNLTVANGFMGISSQESKNILIANNTVVGNNINGVMVRNSLRVSIRNNSIRYNGKNGIEIIEKNIDDIPGRDMRRDPYFKASSAVISNNIIESNYNTNIMIKNGAAVKIYKNKIPNYFGIGGDLNFFYDRIIQNRGSFTLYGLGFPFHARSSDLLELNPYAYKVAKKIYKDIANAPNDYFGTHLAGLYINRESKELTEYELLRASSIFSKGALTFLGFYYLTESRKKGFDDREKIIEGISYIIEDAILSDNVLDFHRLEYLRFFIPNGVYLIEEAFLLAKARMQKGQLFDQKKYEHCSVCKNSLYKKRKVLAAWKVFQYKFKMAKASTFLDYCKSISKQYTIFTTPVKIYFKKHIKEVNAIKAGFNRYYSRVYKLARKYKLCKDYLKNQQRARQQGLSFIRMKKKDILKQVEPEIKKYLEDINRYRFRKISYETVVKNLLLGHDYEK
ncbi:right-handed parallel beta-helix repeat-containing protein [Nitrosophilus labii]|uniref:right-handed parallel beta-helix repeat-containing protein n=1 Tax=Nitrosophilus labii TaxID=2706014 RepID=UPI001656B035|nr:right-handed parallel beta-helix repeat-containing protein [Nitrosophilus labii]